MKIEVSTVDSPTGPVRVATRMGSVVACAFADRWDPHIADLEDRFGALEIAERDSPAGDALARYFAGDLTALDDLAVDPGGTPFQGKVWQALRTIPVGETLSYGDLADRIDAPGAMRAVGSANGANPISLVVPCHRVIRADGNLGGYGGGLDRKAWLLAHEGALLA